MPPPAPSHNQPPGPFPLSSPPNRSAPPLSSLHHQTGCAPGYYRVNATACEPCGTNYVCPGAGTTEMSGAVRTPCGANKITTTAYARSDRQCGERPGLAGSEV
jgi:hypothetical protein